ncbi:MULTISPECIES: hypothetical protein [unclassified Streptomyces]|uniref:hypothetical protein n=1 Tax=unclassified Streptomyces TaxID=2593676 RepID=UPI0004CB7C8D|nr:hypothetical protein [Streptomyces sp. NRRL S-37]
MGMDAGCPDTQDQDDHPWPLLLADGNSRLPGGDTVCLRRTVQEFTASGERYEFHDGTYDPVEV